MRAHILFLLLLGSISVFGQKEALLKKPKVDERIELLSIVFRLAGNKEYNSKYFPTYVEKIENHFGQHKNHALIQYIKQKLKKRGIAYDAVMGMAIDLSDKAPYKPLVPFSKSVPEKRWGKKKATKFLSLLNDFYKETDCETFFKENKALYQKASKRFMNVYEALDVEWYETFYGEKPKGEFRIVNGLGNGSGNYGPKLVLNNKEIIYAIMGTWSVDSLGMPSYKKKNYFPTLLHEFNHSFVNHLVENERKAFKKSGTVIFKELKEKMAKQAYRSWQTVYAEAIVRAAVVKYLKDHDYDEALVKEEIVEQLSRGFVWTSELVDKLEEYDNNREQYASFESFIPQIVTFFDEVAPNIKTQIKNIESKRPKVLKITPFSNGSLNVNPKNDKLEIHFDKPLVGKGYSMNYGPKGKSHFPKITKVTYSEDRKKVILNLELKPNQEYQLVLTGRAFKSEEGFRLNPYQINFKTKEE